MAAPTTTIMAVPSAVYDGPDHSGNNENLPESIGFGGNDDGLPLNRTGEADPGLLLPTSPPRVSSSLLSSSSSPSPSALFVSRESSDNTGYTRSDTKNHSAESNIIPSGPGHPMNNTGSNNSHAGNVVGTPPPRQRPPKSPFSSRVSKPLSNAATTVPTMASGAPTSDDEDALLGTLVGPSDDQEYDNENEGNSADDDDAIQGNDSLNYHHKNAADDALERLVEFQFENGCFIEEMKVAVDDHASLPVTTASPNERNSLPSSTVATANTTTNPTGKSTSVLPQPPSPSFGLASPVRLQAVTFDSEDAKQAESSPPSNVKTRSKRGGTTNSSKAKASSSNNTGAGKTKRTPLAKRKPRMARAKSEPLPFDGQALNDLTGRINRSGGLRGNSKSKRQPGKSSSNRHTKSNSDKNNHDDNDNEKAVQKDGLTGLAVDSMKRGDFATAILLYESIMKEQEARNGPSHPSVADCLHKIGDCCLASSQLERASSCFEKAYSVRVSVFGPYHATVVASLERIGVAMLHRQQVSDAHDAFRNALRIQQKLLGMDHTAVAALQAQLGWIYFSTGELMSSQAAFQDALMVYKQEASQAQHKVRWLLASAEILGNIGSVQLKRSLYGMAAQSFSEALMVSLLLLQNKGNCYLLQQAGVVLDSNSYYTRRRFVVIPVRSIVLIFVLAVCPTPLLQQHQLTPLHTPHRSATHRFETNLLTDSSRVARHIPSIHYSGIGQLGLCASQGPHLRVGCRG